MRIRFSRRAKSPLLAALCFAVVALLLLPPPRTDLTRGSSLDQSFAQGWTRLSLSLEPPWREGAAMTYDASDHYVVLFGGEEGIGTHSVLLNDTWVFSHGEWSQLDPSVSPSARQDAVMAYDSFDGYVVLFGGYGPANYPFPNELNDTWEFRAGQWTEFHPSRSPPPADYPSMTYDTNTQSVILYESESPFAQSNETWEFRGGEWYQLHPIVQAPGVWGSDLAFDNESGEAVLFGGEPVSGTGVTNETWVFNGSNWEQLRPTVSPPNRTFASMAFDPSAGNVVLFGGDCSPGGGVLCPNTTWLFSDGEWSSYAGTRPDPLGTDASPMVFDSLDQFVILLEGPTNGSTEDSTWVFVGPPPSSESTFLGLPGSEGYALVGGVAAVLGIAAALVIARSRRKGKPPIPRSPGPEPGKDSQSTPGESPQPPS